MQFVLVWVKQPKRDDDIKPVPQTVSQLRISRSFCDIITLNHSFLNEPVSTWPDNESFKTASLVVNHLPRVNDHAERGASVRDEQ